MAALLRACELRIMVVTGYDEDVRFPPLRPFLTLPPSPPPLPFLISAAVRQRSTPATPPPSPRLPSNPKAFVDPSGMEKGGIGGADEEAPAPRPSPQQRYRPVESHDRAVIQMAPMESGSSADAFAGPRYIKPGTNLHTDPRTHLASSNGHGASNGSQSDSKLELFGFDSLVNILGLKSMAGEQAQASASPRDGENMGIAIGHPKDTETKLGTMMGVFVPCLQNILGIIYYIRFTWIVGMGGIWQSLILVVFCGACTFLTGISLSAIATNGAMKGGGPYYLIGRALGPEVGVSIGLCFFLGNAVAGAMYVLGAVETFWMPFLLLFFFKRV
ncbi:hypothetical protein GUJ93_ZPchr0001g31757 [Zizania palustris]|uniref:Amino acid permease/ SLC12A domain-containing protein n=1 Tax=Zizania palustris TaxID=103762 RepID=A0A8J5V6G2_ZIZPA|nr:hypothetical protein GUJ93_ZPchr0001g31757 [Zizania palustris]